MADMLLKLGFSQERAEYLAGNILVDPARGSGHAAGAAMRSAKAHLRTRVGKDGMDYKGFNIAVHEMGHNVEQTISLNDVDYYFLNGVPNTAFTEAVAFVFQARDLDLLGLSAADAQAAALKTLNDFWMTYEIAGVSLVDMEIWHWMYDHPDTTPAELKSAVLQIARDIWNTYYAPVFKKKDINLLAIYSHIIHSLLYLPDYAIGHLISHQIEEYLQGKENIGIELERMLKLGSVTPDMWMKNATGSPVSAEPLLSSTQQALEKYKK
jgi:oligoendopeptidase F